MASWVSLDVPPGGHMQTIETAARVAAAGLFIVTASFIPRPVRAADFYTSPRNADVGTSGARAIQIEAKAGILRVEGRSGITQVRVRGTARSERKGSLDDIKLIAERRGDIVFIKADMPERNGSGLWDMMTGRFGQEALDLVIEVPTNLPLEVADGSGDAEFINTGALRLTDGSGAIKVRGAHGDVTIKDGSGSIDLDGVDGSVVITDGSGGIDARNVMGNFTIASDGSGDIVVSRVGGTARIQNDGSGSIDVDRVAGDFVVDNDHGGHIRYDTVKGTVRIPEKKRRS